MPAFGIKTPQEQEDQKAGEAHKIPSGEIRSDIEAVFDNPLQDGGSSILENGQISIDGYDYDGYTIQAYKKDEGKISIGDYRNRNNAVYLFDIEIDDLAAAMRANREANLPPLKEEEPVMAISSDGKLREGWYYRKHPSDPDAVALVGIKDNLPAYVTYPHVTELQKETAIAQAVARYTKFDFVMPSPESGQIEDGWKITHIIEPESDKLRVFNKRTGKERFFDSVDHFLIEAKVAEDQAKMLEKIEKFMERNKIEARTPKHLAYTAMIGSNLHLPTPPEADTYEGRIRITSTSGNIDGQVYMPPGLERKMEAIVVDTSKDRALRAYIEEVTKLLEVAYKGVKTPPDEQILKIIANKIRSDFPYSERMLDKAYAKGKFVPGKKYYLGNFMVKGEESDMVCRHMGLLATIIIEKLKSDPQYGRLFPDDLRCNFMGDQSETKNDRSGHAYAIVAYPSSQGMKYYYLDPVSHEAVKEIGIDLKNREMGRNEARYLFSLLRTIFNTPDPIHTLFLQRVFGIAETNPALKKIARDALAATADPNSRAAVRSFRKQMGLSESI